MPAARNTKAAIRAYAAANDCTYTAAKRILDRRFDDALAEASIGAFGNLTPEQMLYARIKTGAQRIFGMQLPVPVTARLAEEYRLIRDMGFTQYVLAIHDIVAWARGQRIAVSPGVGASPASLVLYCLGVTQVDPIRYDLPFDRFLTPSRQWFVVTTEVAVSRVRDVFDYASANYGPIDFELRGSEDLDRIGSAAAAARVDVHALLAASDEYLGTSETVWKLLPTVGSRRPASISDVADSLALTRLGADGLSQAFTQRRDANDRRGALSDITTDPGELDLIGSVLDETYGLIVYREQMNHLAGVVAGLNGPEQEHLSKMVLKKVRHIDEYQAKFVLGATAWPRRVRFTTAAALFARMVDSSPRTYNRSHAVGQAQQLFADVYLQVNHPDEWAAATTRK
jgi:DNA polymerase III alpha subunit